MVVKAGEFKIEQLICQYSSAELQGIDGYQLEGTQLCTLGSFPLSVKPSLIGLNV